jgi:hypothetical protein
VRQKKKKKKLGLRVRRAAYHFLGTVGALEGVRIDEHAVGVEIVDVLLAERHTVAPVERPNVVLHGVHHLLPALASRQLLSL